MRCCPALRCDSDDRASFRHDIPTRCMICCDAKWQRLRASQGTFAVRCQRCRNRQPAWDERLFRNTRSTGGVRPGRDASSLPGGTLQATTVRWCDAAPKWIFRPMFRRAGCIFRLFLCDTFPIPASGPCWPRTPRVQGMTVAESHDRGGEQAGHVFLHYA